MDKASLLQLFTPSFLTAFQQKLLISMLARLPYSSKNNNITVQFKANTLLSDVEEQLSYKDLQKEMLFLMKKNYVIDTENQLTQINFLSKASFLKGKGIIEVVLNPAIVPYLYELRKAFPLNVLREVLKLKSVYSINIYLLLLEVENGENVSYSIENLKRKLDITGRYNDYNTFKRRVILQAQKELHLTDKAFFFKEEKESRRVAKITFKVYPFDKLYWSQNKSKLANKLINDLQISRIEASKIVFLFIEEEIYNIIYKIKEKEREGVIKTSLGAYAVSFFYQTKNDSKEL